MENLGGAIKLRGKWIFNQFRSGELIRAFTVYNTITNVGVDSVAGLINGLKVTGFTYIELGTSESEAGVTETALRGAIAAGSLARVAATATQHDTDVTNDTAVLTKTFTATATYTVKEAGIFDTATAGVMLARATFTGKAMEASDTLTVYYYIDVD